MQKTDIDTVTNVILNNEYNLHEEKFNDIKKEIDIKRKKH